MCKPARLGVLWLMTGLAANLSWAADSPVEEVRAAIHALAEKPNYSWVSMPKSDNPNLRPGPTDGKTERNGFTYFRLAVGQTAVEAAFKGGKSAIKTEDVWESSLVLQGERAWIARRLTHFQVPAAEAEDLLNKAGPVTKRSGVFSADLTPAGVREILLRRRASATESSEPSKTKGSVKLWIQNGLLSKYEYTIQGAFSSQAGKGVDVNLTTTVEITDVGSTRVLLPEEARRKLM